MRTFAFWRGDEVARWRIPPFTLLTEMTASFSPVGPTPLSSRTFSGVLCTHRPLPGAATAIFEVYGRF